MAFRALGTLTAEDIGRHVVITTDGRTYSGRLQAVHSTWSRGHRVRFELRDGAFTVTGNYLPGDVEVQVRGR